ncbi:biotin--protein ligase isoform X2 [Centruroides vittatus]|uniref:biotin--protein ligase isoform X2 n=1 Tax=Centruroides vittatus TaxID=120091 RepID=UPI003510BE8C
MFLTLCYAFLTVVIQRQRRRLADLLRERLGCGTVLFHKNNSTSSSKFTDGEIKIVKHLLEKDEKRVSLLLPKQKINLSAWNCYRDYQHGQLSRSFPAVNSVNILFEIICCEANERRDRNSRSCLNVEEYCIPMAWRSNEVFGILVKSSVEDLNLLGAAFLNDQLCMSEGKEIHKMMMDVEGSPIDSVHPFSFPLSSPSSWSSCLLQTDSTTSTPLVEQTPELCERLLVEGGAENAEEDFLHTPVFPPLEVIEQQEYCDTYGGSNESLAENVLSLLDESLSDSETSLNEDRDSLCSQLSNEGEAASQSSSPRKLVDSIYCNLDNSIDEFEEAEEYCAGEAMAEGSFSPIPDLDEMIFITNNIPKFDASSKPPNIFIYTGEEESGPSSLFRSIKDNLQLCLKPNCYTIYPLSPTQVNEIGWRDNTELLIVSCDELNEKVNKCFSAFVHSGGKVLSFCSNLDILSYKLSYEDNVLGKSVVKMKYKEWDTVSLMRGRFRCRDGLQKKNVFVLGTNEDDGEALIKVFHSQNNSGISVMCQVHLEVDPALITDDTPTFLHLKDDNVLRISILRDILSEHLKMNCDLAASSLQLTPCYLYAREKSLFEDFMSIVKSKLVNNELKYGDVKLQFNVDENSVGELCTTKNILPVICNSSAEVPFDVETFYSNLKTKILGRILLFIDVVPSTMPILKGLNDFEGCIAISNYQTEGRGRGKNQWLSPRGCAIFTLYVSIPMKSKLGQTISFFQHIVSISLIEGIVLKKGYEDIKLRLKWPNDIYFDKNKLAGILVESTVLAGKINCYVGCGMNIDNSYPTICVNDIIKIYNRNTGNNLPCFTVEEYIALILTRLEINIDKFQNEGYEAFLSTYYKYWLHSGQKVVLNETKEEVTIVGIDNYGYLQVETSSGNMLSLQSDGNSLDMMHNLIKLKT